MPAGPGFSPGRASASIRVTEPLLTIPSSPLRIPVAPRKMPLSSNPDSPASAASAALTVLLVDDHEDTNRSLVLLLGRRGYKVQSATSLAEARVSCGLETFDVLVCDMNLPDGSGLDLLAQLADRAPRLGGIIVSGYNTEEDVARSLAAGYKAHLGKPVELDKLDAAIKRLGR